MKRRNIPTGHYQKGIALGYVLVMIGLLGAAMWLGGNVYFAIVKNQARSTQNSQTVNSLAQAAYQLVVETKDLDGDGQPEAPAMAGSGGAGNCSGTMASADCSVPSTSGASKTDAWGKAYRYCAWDHGASQTTINRLSDGNDNPASQSSVIFAIISAGPDKIFQTTCADAKGGVQKGDDRWVTKTIAQVNQGVGGTVYYGDPVADQTALNLLTPANGYTPKNGEHRLVKATGETTYWNGSAWVNEVPVLSLVVNAGDNCDTYKIGTQARDSAGNPMVCQ